MIGINNYLKTSCVNSVIIFFTVALLIFAGHTYFAQADSAKLKQKNTESTTNARAKN